MSKFLVTNWKSYPDTERQASKLARLSDHKNFVVCPPFIFLHQIGSILRRASLGCQDVFWAKKGAYTGEVSLSELKNAGVEYAIVGHSERRKHLLETDGLINKKVIAGLKTGLRIILCVGESRETRQKGGLAQAKRFVGKQLELDLSNCKSVVKKGRLIVAYEPIWAIGSHKPDKPEDSLEMVLYIKKMLARLINIPGKVLYGGSVDKENIDSFLAYKQIDGVLVGGASLQSGQLSQMAEKIKFYEKH
jgi:triosephosphate isomerase